MADDYVRQNETFRAEEVNAKKIPVMVVGAHARTYKGVQSLVATGASVVTPTVPGGATFAEITMEGVASTDYVRYWHGTSDPSSTTGVKLVDGDTFVSADPATLAFIKGSTGAGGTLRIEYFSYE